MIRSNESFSKILKSLILFFIPLFFHWKLWLFCPTAPLGSEITGRVKTGCLYFHILWSQCITSTVSVLPDKYLSYEPSSCCLPLFTLFCNVLTHPSASAYCHVYRHTQTHMFYKLVSFVDVCVHWTNYDKMHILKKYISCSLFGFDGNHNCSISVIVMDIFSLMLFLKLEIWMYKHAILKWQCKYLHGI